MSVSQRKKRTTPDLQYLLGLAYPSTVTKGHGKNKAAKLGMLSKDSDRYGGLGRMDEEK